MYIPEFWCGVIVGVLGFAAVVVLSSTISQYKKKKKR